ncbi:5' nucleotidase, deoxy (Pyrimidine), cytosolic type C protein (NT5C) [compost metagenome]
MDFWSTPHLYQKLKPKEGCVRVLTELHRQGWEVGFVTYAKKAHLSSKCKWIKEHFPFYSFIHPTKEKGYTRCTHFIDDRHKYLNQMPEDVKLIKMNTPYTQDEGLNRHCTVVNNWKEIEEILCKC